MNIFINELTRLIRDQVEDELNQQKSRYTSEGIKSLVDYKLEKYAEVLFKVLQEKEG